MKSPIAAGLALAAALVVFTPEANAQHHRVIAPTTVVAPVGVGGSTSGYATGYSAAPSFHYSYYAVPNPSGPARGYVGYGTNDFPFYGQPYGHPYDPWTWPYMANGGRGLARYYDPPVR